MAPSIMTVSDPPHIRILTASITLQQSLSSEASFSSLFLFSYTFSPFTVLHFARHKKSGGIVYARHPPPYFFTWRVDRGLDNIISSRFLFFSLSNAKSSLHRSSPESYDTELTLKLRGEPERCLRTTF